MSIKKSIGWTDMTLNPIKGRCKGGCWYCYYSGERGMLNRFKQDPGIELDLSVFDHLPKKSKKIFLCSTHDLFGDWIPRSWRDLIFANFGYYPQHIFQILTKFPQNIDRPMPDNVWLGVTVTGWGDFHKKTYIEKAKAKIKFISFEPLLTEMPWMDLWLEPYHWIIIGRLTQHGHKYDPPREWIKQLVLRANACKCKIFLKDNLKEIWKEPLIQEVPDV